MTEKDNEENKEEGVILEENKSGSLAENKEILDKLDEIIELNKKIEVSSAYSAKRLRNRRVFITVKWSLLVAVIILGFISYNTIFDYLRKNVNDYENIINNVLNQIPDNK